MAREDAVLADQWHQVGHDAHRHQIEVFLQVDPKRHRMVLSPQLFQEAVHQLEYQPDRAEIAPRLIAWPGVNMGVDQDAAGERLLL